MKFSKMAITALLSVSIAFPVQAKGFFSTLGKVTAGVGAVWVGKKAYDSYVATPNSGEVSGKNSVKKGSTFVARVHFVKDGDTVAVSNPNGGKDLSVRLSAIDAPETSCKTDSMCIEQYQEYGKEARTALRDMINGEEVKIAVVDVDRYNRIVGRIYKGNVDINYQMVLSGYAWFYKAYAKPLNDKDYDAYNTAERNARNQHLGLWADNSFIPPWDWRREHKN